jgi:hypothetical protein
VFVFDGPEVDVVLDDMVGYPFEPALRAALDKWRPLVEETRELRGPRTNGVEKRGDVP